ncbi:MAG: hypothetical protein AUI36_31230 [Cyanobacteria bacterium 13_1_40CM_2_61_4]|nr:MAG: hypothetical protein AUI36_31230 [Cyanobacteria bacterium 13_1_40CM_2_61_4]
MASRATLPIFLGNLFFLQSLFSPSFGSNNPLWSLSYEFWYYMLFPVLLFVVSSRLGLQRRLLYAVVGLALFGLIGPTVGFYFLIWLAGAAVGLGPRSTHLRFPRTALLWSALSALLFVLALAFSRARLVKPEMLVDFVVAAGFTLWLYVLVHLPEGRLSRVYSKVARSLAGFSYTLYLTHFPLVLLLRGWLNGETWWQPGARHLLYGLLLSTVVAAYAYLVARLTEANPDAIRRRISLFFSPRQREVAA